jgi:hypothetical protein
VSQGRAPLSQTESAKDSGHYQISAPDARRGRVLRYTGHRTPPVCTTEPTGLKCSQDSVPSLKVEAQVSQTDLRLLGDDDVASASSDTMGGESSRVRGGACNQSLLRSDGFGPTRLRACPGH